MVVWMMKKVGGVDRARPFSEQHGDEMTGNSPGCRREIPVERKGKSSPEHHTKLEVGPGKGVQSPSWDIFKTPLDKALGKLWS